MKYKLRSPQKLTCIDIEKQLGLGRGDVKEVFTYSDGTLEIEISDEIALALEVEVKALAKADQLIDAITTLAGAKVFLKRLCKRLISKGLLP